MRQFAAGFVSCLLLIAAVGFLAHLCAQNYLVASGLAIHLDGKHHCNSFTSGFGIEHPITKTWHLAAGVYDNSNCNVSTYVAGAWMPLQFGSFKLGTIMGLVTGYKSAILPAAGSVLTYERPKWKVNAIFIPPAGDTSNGVIWFQFGVPF